MARIQTNGKMVKVIAGIVLSLAVVLGSVVLAQPKNAGGTLSVIAATAVEEAPYVSSNRQTIVTGPDGQKVIQNSFDGSMVNLDGSPYVPMLTPEQLGTSGTIASTRWSFPALRRIQDYHTIVVGPDGQHVIQNSNGDLFNLDGSVYVPMPMEEKATHSVLPVARPSLMPLENNGGIRFWYEGRWTVQNADGSITDYEYGTRLQ